MTGRKDSKFTNSFSSNGESGVQIRGGGRLGGRLNKSERDLRREWRESASKLDLALLSIDGTRNTEVQLEFCLIFFFFKDEERR